MFTSGTYCNSVCVRRHSGGETEGAEFQTTPSADAQGRHDDASDREAEGMS